MFCDFQKLPRVNKDLAEKLLEEEQRTDSKKRQKVGLSHEYRCISAICITYFPLSDLYIP